MMCDEYFSHVLNLDRVIMVYAILSDINLCRYVVGTDS